MDFFYLYSFFILCSNHFLFSVYNGSINNIILMCSVTRLQNHFHCSLIENVDEDDVSLAWMCFQYNIFKWMTVVAANFIHITLIAFSLLSLDGLWCFKVLTVLSLVEICICRVLETSSHLRKNYPLNVVILKMFFNF